MTSESAGQKRQLLTQMGVSALIGLVAFWVLTADDSGDRGLKFWVILLVLATSVIEILWFAIKYLRLSREQERLN